MRSCASRHSMISDMRSEPGSKLDYVIKTQCVLLSYVMLNVVPVLSVAVVTLKGVNNAKCLMTYY